MEMDLNHIVKKEGAGIFKGNCCGNSFVILDCRDLDLDWHTKSEFAVENIAKYGVDSALFLKKSEKMDVFMEVFEKDGTESDSCGNGALLVAYLLGINEGTVEMKDNVALISGDLQGQGILMSIKFMHLEKICNQEKCFFVRMGEPHVIYCVEDIKKFDLEKRGKEIQKKYPGGVNVDVVQKIGKNRYAIKTYERGVFSVTKSCGTGSLSSYVAISQIDGNIDEEAIEFVSAGGIHRVSRDRSMLKLEASKGQCKIVKVGNYNSSGICVGRLDIFEIVLKVLNFFGEWKEKVLDFIRIK